MSRKTILLPLLLAILLIVGSGLYVYFTKSYLPLVSDLMIKTNLIASASYFKGDIQMMSSKGENSQIIQTAQITGTLKEIKENGLVIQTNTHEYPVQYSMPQEKILVTIPSEKASQIENQEGIFFLDTGRIKVTRTSFLKKDMVVTLILDQLESNDILSTYQIIYVK